MIENDPLPTCVCKECNQKLQLTYEFYNQVYKAQEILKSVKSENDNYFNVDLKFEYYDTCENSNAVNNSFSNKLNEDDSKESINPDDGNKKFDIKFSKITESLLSEMKEDDFYNKRSTRKIPNKKQNKIQKKGKIKTKKLSKVRKDLKEDEENFDDSKNRKWQCLECNDNNFKTVHDYREHYSSFHNKEAVYKCYQCLKVIEKYSTFQKHMINHKNQHKYCCEYCGKFSHSKLDHTRHKESHSNERKYICSTCGKRFKTPGTLRVHEKRHLPPELREQFECDVCNKKLTSHANLWTHKKLHLGIKEHNCDICGRIFSQKTNLLQHLIFIHQKEMPFECELCHRKFKTDRLLKRHKIIHSNNKPHKCDICEKKFRTRQSLKGHKIIHTDDFPFQCEYCEKHFRKKQLLKVHLRQHTGELPYECINCHHSFTHWSNYNKHMKSRHGVNMTKPLTQLLHEQQQQMEENEVLQSSKVQLQ